MLLLGLETSSDVCGVALLDGDRLVAEAALHVPRAHAAHLAPLVRDVLALAGVAAADLGAVAVSAGPGSYTGLRIGASTAKGLCLASGAALVPVPTLAALAAAAAPWVPPGTRVLAALPSRRGEAYVAEVDVTNPTATPPAAAYALDALPPDLAGDDALVVGPSAADVAEAFRWAGCAGIRAAAVPPSAARVALLGRARLLAGLAADAAAFEPDYVTPAYVGAAPVAVTPGDGSPGATEQLS